MLIKDLSKTKIPEDLLLTYLHYSNMNILKTEVDIKFGTKQFIDYIASVYKGNIVSTVQTTA